MPVWSHVGESGTLSLGRRLNLGRVSESRPWGGFSDDGRAWTAGCRRLLRGNLVLNPNRERFSNTCRACRLVGAAHAVASPRAPGAET